MYKVKLHVNQHKQLTDHLSMYFRLLLIVILIEVICFSYKSDGEANKHVIVNSFLEQPLLSYHKLAH